MGQHLRRQPPLAAPSNQTVEQYQTELSWRQVPDLCRLETVGFKCLQKICEPHRRRKTSTSAEVFTIRMKARWFDWSP